MEIGFENNAYIQLFKNVELRVSVPLWYSVFEIHCVVRAFQAEMNDKRTTLIDICFEKTCDFVHFHKICAVTTILMRISLGLSHDADETTPNAVDQLNSAQTATTETQTSLVEITSPRNRSSTAKRRNTEMDSSDLET